jgi:hypothetical protein
LTYDPRKINSDWTPILPGMYADERGALHIFPREIIATLAQIAPSAGFDPNSPGDYELVVNQIIQTVLPVLGIEDVTFIRHETEANN